MIVARFGETWENAYTLGDVEAQNQFVVSRPPIIAKPGGAHGAFDYYGDDGYPIGPLEIAKTFNLTSDTYVGMDLKLDEMKAATISAGRSKLWIVMRDNTVRRWAWAKCIAVENAEEPRGGRFAAPVTVKFTVPEGIWYAENQSRFQQNGMADGAVFTIRSLGTLLTPIRFQVTRPAGSMGSVTIATFGNANSIQFDPVAPFTNVVVDSEKYEVVYAPYAIPGVDGYAYLTLGGTNASRTLWMWLNPGENQFYINWTPETGAGNVNLTALWYDAFL